MGMEVDPTAKQQHLLLMRGLDWDNGLSATELQEAMTKFFDWVKMLEDQGVLEGAQPLATSGKVVSGTGGQNIADGPFAETKEAVGGYFLLNVAELDRAVALSQQCPALQYGAMIEVRPVVQRCHLLDKVEGKPETMAGSKA